MRSIFLLFICVVLLVSMKKYQPKGKRLERIEIEKSQVLRFGGTFFLPRTITIDEGSVKVGAVVLSLQGKNYTYERLYDNRTYFLNPSQSVREIEVNKGDKVACNVKATLFFAVERE
jgi:regulator of protease activity HflC (stomatin/prohibitin superfamily)